MPNLSVLVVAAAFSVHPCGYLVRCQQGRCSYLLPEKVQNMPRSHNLALTSPAFRKCCQQVTEMQHSVGYYREMPAKRFPRWFVHMKKLEHCALVSNSRAGRTVRGHVPPSSLTKSLLYVTAEIFSTYPALAQTKFSTCAAVACW